jgi:hypothetical protein
MPPDQAAALAEKLFTGTWTYDYAIMPEEAKSFGLPVSTDMPKAVYDFMNLFPQPTRTRPGSSTCPRPTGPGGRETIRGPDEGGQSARPVS